MKPTHRQTNITRIVQRSFILFAAAALTAALIGCTGDLPESGPTITPLQTATPTTSPVLATQPSIEAVFSLVPSLPSGDPLRPLFEHLPADRAVVDRLARALETVIPIAPDEHLSANVRGRYLDVRYRDGTKMAIRQVARCEPWTDADAKESAYVGCKGKWVRQTDTWWVEGTGMVKSTHLAQWWEEMTEFMVPIGSIGIPKTIEAGEPFKVTLFSWDGVIDGDFRGSEPGVFGRCRDRSGWVPRVRHLSRATISARPNARRPVLVARLRREFLRAGNDRSY